MEDTTTPSEQELPAGAASVIGGIPVDESGNALVVDETTDTDQPQPQEPAPEAEVRQEDNSTGPEVEVSNEQSEDTKDLLNWAKKKGLDTADTSPAVLKALQLARESERAYHTGQQQRSELQKSFDALKFAYPQAPQVQQVQEPEYDDNGNLVSAVPTAPQAQAQGVDPRDLKIAMLEFRQNHADYQPGSDLDVQLGSIVGENPTFWMNNLDQAYRIAKTNLDSVGVNDRIEAAKEEARREEREKLAKQSKLSQPAPQATGTKPGNDFSKLTPQNLDAWLAQAKPGEYAKRLDEVNTVLASL